MAHDERCGKCKATVRAMLAKIYGRGDPNYRIAPGTRPEGYAGKANRRYTMDPGLRRGEGPDHRAVTIPPSAGDLRNPDIPGYR